jgi:hypothetical protein
MDLKRQYWVLLMFIIPVLSLHASASSLANQAKDFSDKEKRKFTELYGFLIRNDYTPEEVQKFGKLVLDVIETCPELLVKMTTKTPPQTLLEFAIKNSKKFGFIGILAAHIMDQAVRFQDPDFYRYLRQHLDLKQIVTSVVYMMYTFPAFKVDALTLLESHRERGLFDSELDRIWVVACSLYHLLASSLSGNIAEINRHLQILKDFLPKLDDSTLNLSSLLTFNLYYTGQATLPYMWFSQDPAVQNQISKMHMENNIAHMTAEQIISILDCFANAGVRLDQQSTELSDNLMILILTRFHSDLQKCFNLLSYLFKQKCDVNQIVRTPANTSFCLLYKAIVLNCSPSMIIFLLEHQANLYEQLLIITSWKEREITTIHNIVTIPLWTLISQYTASDLATIFSEVACSLDFSQPFILKLQKQVEGVVTYQSYSQSVILTVLLQSDYQEKIKLFLKYGADINQLCSSTTFENMTPLMVEVANARLEHVKFLLNHGARALIPRDDYNAFTILNKQKKIPGLSEASRNILTQIENALENAFDVREQQLQADDLIKRDIILLEEEENFQNILEAIDDDFDHLLRKEQNAQKQAQLQQRHLAIRQRYFQEQQAKLELIKQKQQLRSAEPAVAKELVAVPRVAKALPAHPIAEQTPDQLLQKYPWEVLSRTDRDRVAEYLKHLTQGLTVFIPKELRLKYGLLSNFLNKTNVVVDLDHILSMQLLIKNNEISCVGGHSYQVLQTLIQFPLVHNAEQKVDPVTGCVVFDLRLATFNLQRIFKTTFPENWGTQEILQAIATSEFVKNGPEEEGMEVVYAQTTGEPKIPLKLVFKKASGTFPAKLITAIPVYHLVARQLSSPA